MHVDITQVLESSNKYSELVGLRVVTEDIFPRPHSSLICRPEISYPVNDMSGGGIDFLVKLISGQKRALFTFRTRGNVHVAINVFCLVLCLCGKLNSYLIWLLSCLTDSCSGPGNPYCCSQWLLCLQSCVAVRERGKACSCRGACLPVGFPKISWIRSSRWKSPACGFSLSWVRCFDTHRRSIRHSCSFVGCPRPSRVPQGSRNEHQLPPGPALPLRGS